MKIELPKFTHFRLLYTDIVHVKNFPLHNMGLSTTVLAGNNRITLSKESATKALRNIANAYLIYL